MTREFTITVSIDGQVYTCKVNDSNRQITVNDRLVVQPLCYRLDTALRMLRGAILELEGI